MSRNIKDLEALAGIKEAKKPDLNRIKKGITHSMKKNDMKSVTKVAKEVLADHGQAAFDEIMDFISDIAY